MASLNSIRILHLEPLARNRCIKETMTVTLSELPVEVLHQIISYVPPPSVPIVQAIARKFKDLPQPLLWRHHCRTHFKYWSPEHDLEQKYLGAAGETDWKKLFTNHYSIDRSITCDVNGILASQCNRIEKAERIMGHGYDAKDTLLRHLKVDDDVEDVLARRYFLTDSECARIES